MMLHASTAAQVINVRYEDLRFEQKQRIVERKKKRVPRTATGARPSLFHRIPVTPEAAMSQSFYPAVMARLQ
jgi:hypothetical protein